MISDRGLACPWSSHISELLGSTGSLLSPAHPSIAPGAETCPARANQEKLRQSLS